MAESFTLQTSDSNVQQSDVLGRVSFAASNESNSADARLIGASIHAEAEGDFTETSNPTSLVFSTANSESAMSKIKITSSGHFIPVNNKTYDIGSSSLKFRNIYGETNYTDNVILTSGSAPSPTTSSLYNLSGVLYYEDKAVAILPSGGLANQILQKTSDSSYDLSWINNYATEVDVYVKNTTGSGLLKGQAVYINGAQGDHPTITLAQANTESMSSKTIGLLKQDLANNEFGYVISEGVLTGVNTDSAGSAGDPIWLSSSTPGGLLYGLANKPVAPDNLVFIGYVLRKQQNQGIIYVKVQNGFELEELHNVRIKSLVDNDILTYNSASGLWANTTNPSGSLNNSIVTVSGMFVSGSGALNTGITTVSGMFVSGSGALNDRISTHTHTSSQISDFNSSVSGLLPTISNSGDNRVLTSTGSTLDINAESSLTFDGSSLAVPSGSASVPGLTAIGDPNTGLLFPAVDSVSLSTNSTSRMNINASGYIGVGANGTTARTLLLNKAITGSIASYGLIQQGSVQSDVTTGVTSIYSIMNIAATSFTLPSYTHFTAASNPPTGGAVVTNQIGFQVSSAMTGGTNNWGFRGTLATATGNWNLYIDGTAQNYILGNVGIGTGKTAPSCALDVHGLITANSGNFTTNLQIAGNTLTSGIALNMINSANLYLWSNFR